MKINKKEKQIMSKITSKKAYVTGNMKTLRKQPNFTKYNIGDA